jgi:hypothetical protein
LPNGKYLERMIKERGKVVKKNIAETSPQNHPENDIKEEIRDGILVQRELATGCEAADEKEGGDKAEEIHQAVPADSEGTKMD